VNVKTGRLDGSRLATWPCRRGLRQEAEADLQAQARAPCASISAGGIRLRQNQRQLKGRYDQDTDCAGGFPRRKVDVTSARASGSEVRVSAQVKGPQRNLDAKLLIAAVEGNGDGTDHFKVTIDIDAALSGMA